jgi:ubiquinol-cytochrome c reductase cytochrome c subunit
VFSNAVLKPSEKRDIIAYLNSIQSQPKYGGTNLGSYGPVSEGTFAWLVGIGSCVGFAIWIASSSVRSKKGVSA